MLFGTIILLTLVGEAKAQTCSKNLCADDVAVFGGKILLYPVSHCYNSLLLNMEKMASLLDQHHYNVTMIVNSNYTGSKSNIMMDNIHLAQFQAPSNTLTLCDLESRLASANISMMEIADIWMTASLNFCQALLDSSLLTKLKTESFNLLIVDRADWCSAIVADALDIPFMTVASVATSFSEDELVRFAHTPSIFSTMSYPMSFRDRLMNAITQSLVYLCRLFTLHPLQRLKLEHRVNPEHHITSVYYRAVIDLMNSDRRADYPRPLYNHEVEIGFMYPSINYRNLNQDVLQFISNDEVVLVSFGSNVLSLEERTGEMLRDTFSKLNLKVIWRTNNEKAPTGNVLALSWVPQTELLASGKVRLLITHGGAASTMEAIYYGVPMIVLPMHVEQQSQASKLTNYLKVAKTLHLNEMEAEEFESVIVDVLRDGSDIRRNVKSLSAEIQNSPMDPKDTFLYWVNETVVGSRHHSEVRTPRRPQNLNTAQWLLLDVSIFLLLFFLFVFVFAIPYLASRLYKYLHY